MLVSSLNMVKKEKNGKSQRTFFIFVSGRNQVTTNLENNVPKTGPMICDTTKVAAAMICDTNKTAAPMTCDTNKMTAPMRCDTTKWRRP